MTKNITLSADDKLIEAARLRATSEHKSLNVVFREWLFRYANNRKNVGNFDSIMLSLKYAEAGKHFSREELNER